MSLIEDAKAFFGLGPAADHDDAYYDDSQYLDDGAAAYQPAPRYDAAPAPRHRAYEPARRTYRSSTQVVEPRTYNDAATIGESFRDGDAVIFELTYTDKAVQKRIVDFAAGLCFAVRGDMHNLSRGLNTDRRIFAIVPEHAGITVDELLAEAGLNG